MNWPRVKTILIFLFLAVDLILLATIIVPSVGLSHIPQETIGHTMALLESKGISISEDVIPTRRESLGIVELYNLWPDKSKLAQKLVGTTDSSDGKTFINQSKSLVLSDSQFEYKNSLGEKSIAHELIDMGIDVRDNLYEQGESSLRSWQSVDGKKIFESEIYAYQEDSVITVSGYWIFPDRENGIITNTPDTLLDITGVLIDFISNPLRDDNIRITSVELGYSAGSAYRDTTHKLVSVSPAYKINTDTGAYYIYDALSGDFLYAMKNGEIKQK